VIDAAKEVAEQVGVPNAAQATGIPRSTLYRHRKPTKPRPSTVPRPQPRSLAPEEREEVMKLLHSENFVDMAPRAVHAALLEQGVYLCSPRTMYRLLAAHGESRPRRQSERKDRFARPELLATRPNEVWTWDVTWLRGPSKGERYALYVMLDLFSRYVVGWMLAATENGELASDFIRQCHETQGIEPGTLTVHSDRGSAQKSEKARKLADLLEVARSYGRPRVCNDNPFSESINKTVKYHRDYPNRFDGFEHAKTYCREFFAWYNHEHRHSGIAMLAPAIVHAGEAAPIIEIRQDALDTGFAAHPERFVHGPPVATKLPAAVYLNKPEPKPGPAAHYS
jgi:putative transposase